MWDAAPYNRLLGIHKNMALRIIKWFWKSWPVIVVIGFWCIHLLLLNYLNAPDEKINAFISLFAQLSGGLLVLYSIDDNIGLFKKGGIIEELKSYLLTFPLIKRNITLNLDSGNFKISGGEANLAVSRNPQTIEEHIEYLQEQINELKFNVDKKYSKLNQVIGELDTRISNSIEENSSAISDIKSKLESFAIGGLKLQFFGVLLVIYGAFAGYYA